MCLQTLREKKESQSEGITNKINLFEIDGSVQRNNSYRIDWVRFMKTHTAEASAPRLNELASFCCFFFSFLLILRHTDLLQCSSHYCMDDEEMEWHYCFMWMEHKTVFRHSFSVSVLSCHLKSLLLLFIVYLSAQGIYYSACDFAQYRTVWAYSFEHSWQSKNYC